MQLFYNSGLSDSSTDLSFDRTESRHIVKVLRKKEGDLLHITNGKNFLFNAIISSANDKKCTVKIVEVIPQKPKHQYRVHVAMAPTKNNSRFEWFLEKATEIGVDSIYPIICSHSERKVIKHDRMQKLIQTAMKQSLQFALPSLHQQVTFDNFVTQKFNGQGFIAQSESETSGIPIKSLQTQLKKNTDVCILIGPEGGFSLQEISLALQNDYIPVSLGDTRLRTETAGVIAVSTIALVNEK